jgi:hypothetical protein
MLKERELLGKTNYYFIKIKFEFRATFIHWDNDNEKKKTNKSKQSESIWLFVDKLSLLATLACTLPPDTWTDFWFKTLNQRKCLELVFSRCARDGKKPENDVYIFGDM